MKKHEVNGEQLALALVKGEGEKHVPRKRVDIVSLLLVREKSLVYKYRTIRSPEDAYKLFKQFLGEIRSGVFCGDGTGGEEPTDSDKCLSY